jgi:hypothetical protein
VLVLASREMSALVRLRFAPAGGSEQGKLAAFVLAGDYDPPALRAAMASRPVYEAATGASREHVFEVPLPAGLSTIVLVLRRVAGSRRPEAAGVPIESLRLEPSEQPIRAAPGRPVAGRGPTTTDPEPSTPDGPWSAVARTAG